MQQRSKLAIGFTSIVLAGTLALGAVASAGGNGEGENFGRRHRRHLTDEQKCNNSEAIEARVLTFQEKMAERVTTLQEKRTEAEAAGDTELVAQIDHWLERLDQLGTRVSERLGGFQTWVIENCDA